MKKFTYTLILIFTLSLMGCKAQNTPKLNTKPNIIFVMADDLGYADLGA